MTSAFQEDILLEMAPDTPRSKEAQTRLLQESRAFAQPSRLAGAWQLASTLALLGLTLEAIAYQGPHPLKWLLAPVVTGLFVRLFVLQHDLGHLCLLPGKRLNDFWGQLLAFITGVAYHAWRSEHNWHHAHQGKLSRRGIDRMNSPMTREEAIAEPAGAALRVEKISLPGVFVLGTLSLVVERKRHKAFFPFRPKFRWPVPDRAGMIRSVWVTNLGHLAFHAALIVWLGAVSWAFLLLPAMLAGAGFGSLLFWVQHNFELTHHADDESWSFVDAALKGSSYLRLPALLNWFSGSIGLHHVHHLNPSIPNYRLEQARTALPELAAVTPLSAEDLKRCFSHVFWDDELGRMVAPGEASGILAG